MNLINGDPHPISLKNLKKHELIDLLHQNGLDTNGKVEGLQTRARQLVRKHNKMVRNKIDFELNNGFELPIDDTSLMNSVYDFVNKALLSSYTTKKYHYLGPGTPLSRNIMNGIKPINTLDRVAFEHDISYLKIGEEKGKGMSDEDVSEMVKRSDTVFIDHVKRLIEHHQIPESEISTAQKAIEVMEAKLRSWKDSIKIQPIKPLTKEREHELKKERTSLKRIEPDLFKREAAEDEGEDEGKEESERQARNRAEFDRQQEEEGDIEHQREAERRAMEAAAEEEMGRLEHKARMKGIGGDAAAVGAGDVKMGGGYKSVPIQLAVAHKPPPPVVPLYMTHAQRAAEAKRGKEIEEFHAEQVKGEAAKKEEMRVRYTDKVITGERSMRADLTYLGGDYVKLTPEEKARNVAFYSSLNFVKEGNGNGNQQIVPFSYKGWTPNNRLIDSNNRQTRLRYGGHLNFGNQFVQTYKEPTQPTLHKFGVIGIPSNQHDQQWMAVAPTSAIGYQAKTVGQPIQFASRETQPTMHTEVYSQDRRLFHGNLVNGDPWGKTGVRV